MNKKAQTGPIGAVLFYMLFLLSWFIWLSSWISSVGLSAVSDNSLTGAEAFFFSNLNIFIFLILITGMLVYLVWSS